MAAEHAQDRRKSYRHAYNGTCVIEQRCPLRDLSDGGAGLHLPFELPAGLRMHVRINDADPLLRSIPAQVLGCRPLKHGFFVHVCFVEMQMGTQRALQRYLIALQNGSVK